jgi:hypothetical protein
VFPLKNKEKLLYEPSFTSNEIVDYVQELRRSKRVRMEMNFGIIDDDSTCYNEAIKSIDTPFWLEAINNKLDSIMFIHT